MERDKAINTDTNFSPEPHEHDESVRLLWLAGALEIGGTITFSIQNKDQLAYPIVIFNDSNEEFIRYLKRNVNAGSIPSSNRSQLRLTGYKAADLIVSIKPYAVSRRKMVAAVESWLNSDTSERIRIAQDLKGHDRFQKTTKKAYSNLIKVPAFVAGIIDYKGSINSKVGRKVQHTQTRVEIGSKNYKLLLALKDRFGGWIEHIVEEGEERNIMGRIVNVKNNSYGWRIVGKDAQRLIKFALPYLATAPLIGYPSRDKSFSKSATKTLGSDSVIFIG